ncbi:hypothetical protein Q4503_11190 [Colwellia sp. 6_MG-2023]|uniref:hypothetical protein n=1 Tax=Colwellia sp. 6_MG-2023 TaxID=3062676 RepID=UPI0026E2D2D7|nr:hypothetical protein [Colwellia sp. 6_MG-2023]MDO6488269.1 hypothetical protein [Colwellia sp. 6_MG-2023]
MDNSYPIHGLLKFFSCKEHMDSFKRGKVKFATPHYYRTNPNPNIADQLESCIEFSTDTNNFEKIISKYEGANGIDILKSKNNLLICPNHEPKDAFIQCWFALGSHNKFEDSLSKMLMNFGSYFVFLDVKKIETYKQRLLKKSGLKVKGNIVNYTDDNLKHSLIVKKQDLEYQKEFRFFLGECEKNNAEDRFFELGSLKPILTEMRSGKVISADGTITYFTSGHSEVVKSK